jgi:hypothetical protein
VAAKPSGKITTKEKPSGVFTGRDNAKFTAMSALPPKADIGTESRNVRFVPKADSCAAPSSDLELSLEGPGLLSDDPSKGGRPHERPTCDTFAK